MAWPPVWWCYKAVWCHLQALFTFHSDRKPHVRMTSWYPKPYIKLTLWVMQILRTLIFAAFYVNFQILTLFHIIFWQNYPLGYIIFWQKDPFTSNWATVKNIFYTTWYTPCKFCIPCWWPISILVLTIAMTLHNVFFVVKRWELHKTTARLAIIYDEIYPISVYTRAITQLYNSIATVVRSYSSAPDVFMANLKCAYLY